MDVVMQDFQQINLALGHVLTLWQKREGRTFLAWYLAAAVVIYQAGRYAIFEKNFEIFAIEF